ncbi:MAG: transposase, partial [Gammaproteobacteria bacterium]|nr:transposase [Gammaproteobacteria bacterium]
TGFVTDANLMLDMRNHWTSYYKWLQNGRWSWLALARQFVRLILRTVKADVVHLVIDDTLTHRASKKAPGSKIHHQHGNKPNLAQYVRGQCWVSLACAVKGDSDGVIALPLLSRLIPSAGNTGGFYSYLIFKQSSSLSGPFKLFNRQGIWYQHRLGTILEVVVVVTVQSDGESPGLALR